MLVTNDTQIHTQTDTDTDTDTGVVAPTAGIPRLEHAAAHTASVTTSSAPSLARPRTNCHARNQSDGAPRENGWLY